MVVISHAKDAKNADSFLSLTQKYNSSARTEFLFSHTEFTEFTDFPYDKKRFTLTLESTE